MRRLGKSMMSTLCCSSIIVHCIESCDHVSSVTDGHSFLKAHVDQSGSSLMKNLKFDFVAACNGHRGKMACVLT